MHKRILTLLSAAAFCSLVSPTAHASMVGSSVTGSLTFTGDPTNYFNPGIGFVPSPGYLNAAGTTVAISSSATEFGFDDGASLISADFSASQLVISDLIELPGAVSGFELSFVDAAFAGQSLSLSSGGTIPSRFSLVGNTITVDYTGRSVTAGQKFTSPLSIAPVPEPSTLTLTATSLLAGAAALARSQRKRLGFS